MLELTNSDVLHQFRCSIWSVLPTTPLLISESPEKGLAPLKAKYGIITHNVKATVTLEKHPSDKISFTVGTYFSVFWTSFIIHFYTLPMLLLYFWMRFSDASLYILKIFSLLVKKETMYCTWSHMQQDALCVQPHKKQFHFHNQTATHNKCVFKFLKGWM